MAESAKSQPYQVVSRRYRPQAFDELIGQPHMTQALTKAIEQNRVGHAYLFTGARGTGKTSTARIFAKCLNCFSGPTISPCQTCDSCQGIAVGEDLDVIEIDGASNRGIDEIRQLRSNVGIRPSRSRYKIYVIDEVHMLTAQAFNALLKTLEEPPGHVKFIFCTTDPQKVPITVLSRCQRYDFMPVETSQIAESLARIVAQEHVQAEPEALELLARRAAGSLRDSQSLLEQLLSFCTEKISLTDVLSLLGIADSQRILTLAHRLLDRDVAGVLQEIDRAVQEGVEIGQLTQQMIGLFRDAIALKVGCDQSLLLQVVGEGVAGLRQLVDRASLEQWMAGLQIMDVALTKMQYSLHSRILMEAACVRICQLEQLKSLGELLGKVATNHEGALPGESLKPIGATQLAGKIERPISEGVAESQRPPMAASSSQIPDPTMDTVAKKKEPLADDLPAPAVGEVAVAEVAVADTDPISLWNAVVAQEGGVTAAFISQYVSVTWADQHLLRVVLNSQYHCQMCNRPERKERLENVVRALAGRTIRLDFQADLTANPPHRAAAPKRTSRRQMQQSLEQHPFVRQAIELFDADVIDFRMGQAKPVVASDEQTDETELIDNFYDTGADSVEGQDPLQINTEEIAKHV